MSHRYATIRRAAEEFGVTHHTIRNYIKRAYFPVYRLPGVKDACVDINEVRVALDRLPAARARLGYGSFGPNAKVVDLSNVVFDVQVEQ